MDRYHDVALMPLIMLVFIETAIMLFQPFSKYCAIHQLPPLFHFTRAL